MEHEIWHYHLCDAVKQKWVLMWKDYIDQLFIELWYIWWKPIKIDPVEFHRYSHFGASQYNNLNILTCFIFSLIITLCKEHHEIAIIVDKTNYTIYSFLNRRTTHWETTACIKGCRDACLIYSQRKTKNIDSYLFTSNYPSSLNWKRLAV